MIEDTHALGRIITFYSYKGGTGRSMALANLAWILAANGKRVLMMDWDLEAPGLHRYFHPFLADKELSTSRGLLDLLVDYADMAIQPPVEGESDEWYEPLTNLSPYILGVNFESFPRNGRIDLLAAGRQGSTYASKLQAFDWNTFYDRLGGGAYLEALKKKLRADYDYVLVDSRTGVTDTAGICTVQLPDTLVIVFTYNNQSIRGALAVAQSALDARKQLPAQFSTTPFRVFPVPSRVDPFEVQKLQLRQDFARRLFAPLINHIPDQNHNTYWSGVEIPYNAYLSYEEVLSPLIFDPNDAKMPLAAALRLAKEISDGDISSYSLVMSPTQKKVLLSKFADIDSAEGAGEFKQHVEIEPNSVIDEAETVVSRFDRASTALAQTLLLRFVRLPGAHEPPGLKPLIVRASDIPENEQSVFASLAEAGVINQASSSSAESGPYFKLSDKRLLTEWQRLSEWVASWKTYLEIREWIRSAHEQWQLSGKPNNLLLSKTLVEHAIQFSVAGAPIFINSELADFVDRSISFRNQTQGDRQSTRLHAFVSMPCGIKSSSDGEPANFDLIFSQILRPALEMAGFDVFRVEDEAPVGDINEDMFQELLISDLVLVDLSADNPRVWYELGIRHALRSRGAVLVCNTSRTRAFDIWNRRIYNYHLKDGTPDLAHLEDDIKAIAELVRASHDGKSSQSMSPVYTQLLNLIEPDWKSLRVTNATEFWFRFDNWETFIEQARVAGHPEDILTLAEEAPTTALQIEVRLQAGKALKAKHQYHLALEQFDAVLESDPANLEAGRMRGECLQRLNQPDDARAAYEKILSTHPGDIETWSRLGRLEKDAWIAVWNREGRTSEDMRDDAAYEDAMLRRAIDTYSTAFRLSPYNYYLGISAVTLMHLYRDLTADSHFDVEASSMAGAINWAANNKQIDSNPYWAKVTLGELAVLQGTPSDVAQAYKAAILYADNDWFALDSTLSQLRLLAAIGFAPDNVAAGIATLERALLRLRPPEQNWQPDKTFLFSGHMVDGPNRKEPRFPADKEAIAAEAIAKALDDQGAGQNDLALTQGASGGDLLFAEAAIARGMRVQLLLPLPEPEFVTQSILPASNGDDWRKRYYTLRGNPLCLPPRVMPDCIGPPPTDSRGNSMSPFGRCNLWLLNSALAFGVSRTRFICLWNGSGDNGPGGVEHMIKEIQKRTGQVMWLDTRNMW